ncbi:MAG: hypothetical protein Ct9H90mP11_04860 [Acidimicrobiales bacterium]|nr:MAG: hypothetical protein Ct9H90mP11_04860 [Acidimicrobiales bacterium]
MYFVARLMGKIVAFLSPLLRRGGGTSAPGMVLLRLHPKALSKLSGSLVRGSVLISATNGKTTTTRFLSEILNDAGVACVSNTSGANLKSGVATALLTKERHHDMGVLEVDEAALPEVVKESRPRMLILMNLFRDQLDRYGELESIAKRWREMVLELHPDTKLLVNADDPKFLQLLDYKDLALFSSGLETHLVTHATSYSTHQILQTVRSALHRYLITMSR